MTILNSKLRVAWFSPLNFDGKVRSSSTSAYFTDLVSNKLKTSFEIDFYTDADGEYQGTPTLNYLSFYQHHRKNPYSIVFYQFEDSKAANFVRMHLGLIPGITLFHDLLIKEEMPPPLTFSAWPEILKGFNQNSLTFPKKYPQPDRGPFAYREVSLSPVSLFTSQRLCGEAKRLVPDFIGSNEYQGQLSKLYLPMPTSDNVQLSMRDKSKDVLEIVFAGDVGVEHRAHKVLLALREVSIDYRLKWLVSNKDISRAKELCSEFAVLNVEILVEKSPKKWSELVAKSDLALHTLFSVYGTPGPYLQISLMAGTPSVVTDFAEGEYIPNDVVFKIEPGNQEAQQLSKTIESFYFLKLDEREAISKNARRYALENYASNVTAENLKDIFLREAPFFSNIYRHWQDIEMFGRQEVLAANFEIFDQKYLHDAFKELGFLENA
ncbi:MAG: hypothetical protein SGJ02_07540 [bacterium]|nr:hypothetical protein [bacterium]